MTDAVKVEGAERLASTLEDFARSLGDLTDANARAGQSVGRVAAGRAPRRSGRLAGSLRVDVAPTDVDISFGAAHAGAIHWGVGRRVGMRGPHNIAPTLYLTTALADQEETVAGIFAEAVEARLGKVRGA